MKEHERTSLLCIELWEGGCKASPRGYGNEKGDSSVYQALVPTPPRLTETFVILEKTCCGISERGVQVGQGRRIIGLLLLHPPKTRRNTVLLSSSGNRCYD